MKSFVLKITCIVGLLSYFACGEDKIKTFFAEKVEGTVEPIFLTNRVVRATNATNVFNKISNNGYQICGDVQEAKILFGTLTAQILKFEQSGNDLSNKFSVAYVATTNANIGGFYGITELMASYSNMGGKIFKQYKEGMGNLCFVTEWTNPTLNPCDIDVLFFCRDNIAVEITPLSPSNIMPFAHLLDVYILATP